MHTRDAKRSRRQRRILWVVVLLLAGVYGGLLVPAPPLPRGAGKKPFLWNRQEFWSELERQFREARSEPPDKLQAAFDAALARCTQTLAQISATNLPPSAPIFDEMETNFFHLATAAAAGSARLPLTGFLETYTQMRREVKRQSEHWPMDKRETRERLYRALYGGRAAVEEVLLQSPREKFPDLLPGDSAATPTPSAVVQGVTLHSGDVLVSRGGAATSALIARGNDFPGNFSHVALVHVDAQTKKVSVIESHIERGVAVGPIEAYLADKKLRIMALRLRADLPALDLKPLLPHTAASDALLDATTRHIRYDFAMDYADPAKQFCSEVAAAAYKPCGVTLWMGLSQLSTPGLVAWLSALGVKHFETQEPSDLEYDPQLRVVAEWRDPETLFKDHADNAVIDVLLEGAERGDRLDYDLYRLPLARLAKGWSVVKNWFGGIGPIPEGMPAATALRVQKLKAVHAHIKAHLLAEAAKFKAEKGYTPPYWELVRLAREARDQSR